MYWEMRSKDTFTVTVLPNTYFDSAFVTTWDVSAGDTIYVPLNGATFSSTYDFWVDWGDGSVPQRIIGGDDPNSSHAYMTSDTFEISITGSYPHFKLANHSQAIKLLSIEQWGNIAWESMDSAFSGATDLELNATDTPNLSGVQRMRSMFAGASKLNADLSGWNVSNALSMSRMFSGATSFNGDIGGWDVARTEFMTGMFSGATSFNQDIRSWDVSQVTHMSSMFSGATSFNQDIGSWNVARVNFMTEMFNDATSFNQNIGDWDDVSQVTHMISMFAGATSFNQDIGVWNVSNARYMSGMFNGAASFNQDIGGWDVARVELMTEMFNGAASFNQDIGGWNVSNVLHFNEFLNESGMSTYNYEELLINWNASLDLADNLIFHAVVLDPSDPTDTIGIKYRLRAEPARDSIITNDLWTIYDGGLTSNSAPFVLASLPDIVLREGFTSQTLSTRLDTIFKDDDGDPLVFSAISLDGSVIGSMVRSDEYLSVE